MRFGELFAGVGGLGMAVAAEFNAEPAWFAESAAAPSKVLAHHYPTVPNLGDVTMIDWETVERVQILAGGFPCQDVSVAGARKGLRDGTRSGLWSEFALAIAQIRPSWVVIENVGGLLSAEAHSNVEPCPWCLGDGSGEHALRALGAVLADLADLGFDAEWVSVRASDVGAPHQRLRVFILAWPVSETDDMTGLSHPTRNGFGSRDTLPLLPTPVVNDIGDDKTVAWWDNWTDSMRAKHGNGDGHGASLAIEAQRTLLPTPGAYDGDRGGSQHPDKRRDGGHSVSLQDTVEHVADWGPYAPAIRRWEDVIGRDAPDPVRRDGRDGKARLNPDLVEWMMGWPHGWVTGPAIGITRSEQLKACGGGVVTLQARAALRELLARPGVPVMVSQ